MSVVLNIITGEKKVREGKRTVTILKSSAAEQTRYPAGSLGSRGFTREPSHPITPRFTLGASVKIFFTLPFSDSSALA